MTVLTVMGPAGGPMRPPYGSFGGKLPSAKAARLTVMGPAGAPMRPPYASFSGKAPPPSSSGVFTVSGGGVSMVFAEFFLDVVRTDAPVCLRTN